MTPSYRCRAVSLAFSLWVLAGCGHVALRDADKLVQAGRPDQAISVLAEASAKRPNDIELRAALLRQRGALFNRLLQQAESARASGRVDEVRVLIERLAALDASHPRVAALRIDLDRAARQEAWLVEARQAMTSGRLDAAQARLQQVLAESPGDPQASALQQRLRERTRFDPPPQALGPQFQNPVTLEFREAPLRAVLEGMGRNSGINFVFDKEVRPDTKVTIYLKNVSIDDALKVILSTQQLDRKLLNDSTVLIYPNTQAKQREHQELVTRSFFLNNADAKQAQNLVRTIARTRDMFIDERLNLLVVRDTPEVVQLAAQLIANLDLPEPEVMLEVEVLEISSNRLDELGLQWPEQVSFGIPGATGAINWSDRGSFRASIANPAVLATLRSTVGRSNTLANPRLRARNREKAKVLIGEKLPVFTTTSTANVGVSSSVSYLDVGLKLEVEPTVQLDNDVLIKVNLEVSSLISRVLGPQGSVAYQIGSRQASTALRLHDGETQVLAGLIREEDGKTIAGVPGLSSAPLVGRLFGLHSDSGTKSEVVLLITPRVLRNIGLPDANVTQLASGVEANPGALSLRLSKSSSVGVPMSTGSGSGGAAANVAAASGAAASPEPQSDGQGRLVVAASATAAAGGTAAVTLQNRSSVLLRGELQFDTGLLSPAQAVESGAGGLTFELSAGEERVFLFRALASAAGKTARIAVSGLSATASDGQAAPAVRVEGDTQITISAK